MDLNIEHATENAALPHEYKDDAGKCEVCREPEASLLHQAWARSQIGQEQASAGRPELTREFGS